jgi:hypothetical protein
LKEFSGRLLVVKSEQVENAVSSKNAVAIGRGF